MRHVEQEGRPRRWVAVGLPHARRRRRPPGRQDIQSEYEGCSDAGGSGAVKVCGAVARCCSCGVLGNVYFVVCINVHR